MPEPSSGYYWVRRVRAANLPQPSPEVGFVDYSDTPVSVWLTGRAEHLELKEDVVRVVSPEIQPPETE